MTDETKETEDKLATTEKEAGIAPGFGGTSAFELLQRQAQVLAQSDLVPKEFRDNIANCVIALEMAGRIGASPLAVVQNMYIVHGKPSWSSQFIIAAINATKKFSPLRFQMDDDKGGSCIVWAEEKATGERLEGPRVSLEMAKAEGWVQKNGSKWKTMPDLMLRYRAATFFGRLYAPEVLMGMQTYDEVIDVGVTEAGPSATEVADRFKAEPVEAEVVGLDSSDANRENYEEPPPAEEGESEDSSLITTKQMKKMCATFTEIGLKDTDEMKEWLSMNMKIVVESLTELKKYQAVTIIDFLETR
jgi:hypothetical protein